MGRPASPNVKYFQRQLNDAERSILLAAGAGDMSKGFKEVIDVYQHFWGYGLRPDTDVKRVVIVVPHTEGE